MMPTMFAFRLTIGYVFQENLEELSVQQLRVYAAAQNLFTGYKGDGSGEW